MRAFILRRVGLIRHAQGGIALIGSVHGADTMRLQRFLSRNGYPHRLLDTDGSRDPEGLLERFNVAPGDLPVIIAPREEVLRNPSNATLADKLGMTEPFDAATVFDLAVVGAGPAGASPPLCTRLRKV